MPKRVCDVLWWGVYNTFLVEEIQKKSKAKIEVPVAELIDFKEALIFGFLGLLKLQGSVNCLASVTEQNKITQLEKYLFQNLID